MRVVITLGDQLAGGLDPRHRGGVVLHVDPPGRVVHAVGMAAQAPPLDVRPEDLPAGVYASLVALLGARELERIVRRDGLDGWPSPPILGVSAASMRDHLSDIGHPGELARGDIVHAFEMDAP